MSNCTTIQGMLPLHVGGDLEADDAKRVAAHLGDCPDCQDAMSRAQVARGALRTELLAQVDGHEPQLWPALRERLHAEGLIRTPESGPVTQDGMPAGQSRSAAARTGWRSLPRTAAAVAASALALAYVATGGLGGGPTGPDGGRTDGLVGAGSVTDGMVEERGPAEGAVDPASASGARGAGQAFALTPTSLQPGAGGLAEADTTPGLQPVPLQSMPLFDQAREEILQQGQPLYMMPATQPLADEGDLASSLRLQ